MPPVQPKAPKLQSWLTTIIVILLFILVAVFFPPVRQNTSDLVQVDDNQVANITESINMNRKQAIADIVNRQAQAWQNADAAAIVADFAADATFMVPGSTFKGEQAIREAAQNYFDQFTETKIKIKRIIAEDNEGAVEWDWTDKNKQTGKQSYAEDAIIFALQDGKITYWREYIEDKSAEENN